MKRFSFLLLCLTISCSIGVPITDPTYVPPRNDLIDCSRISDKKDSDDTVKECFSDVEFCCDKETQKVNTK